MAAAAILDLTPFRYCDFGRLLVCYSPSEIVPETVEKPFLAIFLGLNRIFTGLIRLNELVASLLNAEKLILVGRSYIQTCVFAIHRPRLTKLSTGMRVRECSCMACNAVWRLMIACYVLKIFAINSQNNGRFATQIVLPVFFS